MSVTAAAQRLLQEARSEDNRAQRLRTDVPEQAWDEERHHVNLIVWAAAHIPDLPPLALLFHVPNGGKREQRVSRSGQRYSPEAARLLRMGTRTGYPDLALDHPIHGRAGLRLELKSLTGTLRPDQRAWIVHLRHAGYHADAAWGWRDARRVLLEYFLPAPPATRWTPRSKTPLDDHPLPPLGHK
ncbi:VRR-NUC domain-containing protein [Deinococcus radiotolerans]|uniref:VRR-NUC domain-containing protein n=1 Tax=Deinococcus radiotolerans TaxID=1309407 RepID=A0ABQ2FQD0_9DEIO|nr:VRR-NUC domain-containing protein [Deinococcus radiotolerans]GGL16548.1 hypothetical protein GCM10010844_39290 [Deinococcus radiotolerans]